MTIETKVHCNAPGCERTAPLTASNWLEVGWLDPGGDDRKWHACSWEHLGKIAP